MLGVFYWQNYFETANFSATATYACWATDEQPSMSQDNFIEAAKLKRFANVEIHAASLSSV